MTTIRSERMIESAPSYYETSTVYEQIIQAKADELDLVEANNEDLARQLVVATATWGLKYWEEALGIPTKETDSYEIRRGRVTAKRIGPGNFSAKHLHAIAAGYGGKIRVSINVAAQLITVTFLKGIPTYLDDYKELVENIIHAHLGVEYKFEWSVEGNLGLKATSTRYVYNLPIVGLLCGTWPQPVEKVQTMETVTVEADTGESETVAQQYKFASATRYAATK